MQVVPILHHHDGAHAVTCGRILLDHRIARQRVGRLVGILCIVRFDRLVNAAQIDGPVIASVEAKGRAAAAHMDAVDVILSP